MKQSGKPRRASIQFGGEMEISLPEGTKVLRRTSITFKETTNVRCVAPVKELTPDPSALWVQNDEFKRSKEKALDIADLADSGRRGKYCVRGLEKYIGPAKTLASERRNEAWESVLDEQHLQRCSGEFDEEHIANVYKYATMDTQKEANARAVMDAQEIETYLRNTRRLYRRMSM
mmetsp:Transcript_25020/g.38277  ORF Transcript_25020/g.38277 Transcript_25020/m.38277 type:complete len:175 (-) Transcript_25020:28-552(-)